MIYVLKCDVNSEATDYYLETISKMFLNAGYESVFCKYDENISKDSIIVVSTVLEFYRYYKKGYKNIFYWMQGIESEESFLKHKNIIKKIGLNYLTKFAIKKSIGIFLVSKEMKYFIEKKFKVNISEKSFVMPCFNSNISKQSFMKKNKYSDNIFTYIGSLSNWQCFDETIDFYKKIATKIKNTSLEIYTFSVEEAKKKLDEKGITNYIVKRVKAEEMDEVLKNVKFGFTIRDDNPVNNVATPTKFSTYLASGVIPIFSDCIKDFYNNTKNMKYVIPVKNTQEVPNKLVELCNSNINPNEIIEEYNILFDSYYNRDKYISESEEWIKNSLNKIK